MTIRDKTVAARLEARLRAAIEGEVLFDAFSRARYSTDASIYKIMPLGAVLPKTEADVAAIAAIAAEEGVPLAARGGGTSTAGQTVTEGLVVDFSKYLRHMTFYDLRSMTCVVQPGMTLNALNIELSKLGVWFPVDIWSGSQATLGGMCGNNAVGLRNLKYGAMRDNVTAIDAVLPDGSEVCFGEIRDNAMAAPSTRSNKDIAFDLLQIGERYETMIRAAAKTAPAHAGGYHLSALLPETGLNNLASLLVGSEGTLALFRRIELKVQPLPRNWALGVCQFPTLRKALEAISVVASLTPSAIDLLEAETFLQAGQAHIKIVERYLRGGSGALLIVEFAEDNQVENVRRLKSLQEAVSAREFGGRVIEAVGTEVQRAVWDARDAALEAQFRAVHGRGLPFLEDCAVPFSDLVSFTDRVGEMLARAGVAAAWCGFAQGGAFALRPLYSLPPGCDRARLRGVAEDISGHVRGLKGALSSGQGSGLARSEFIESVYGRSTISIFEEVKAMFDPEMRFNPGKIVFGPRVDDPMLLRTKANGGSGGRLALDWRSPPGVNGALAAADACNGSGVCRKLEGGGMCPAFRVTRDERQSPRGMANALRLALSADDERGLAGQDVQDALASCVSCKACKTECPMGVDITALKIEAASARAANGLPLSDKMFAYLPHYAGAARKLRWALYLRDVAPPLARASQRALRFSAERSVPRWRGRRLRLNGPVGPDNGREVALFADTFNRHFEPDNVRAAIDVLSAGGYRVHVLAAPNNERPLCCGRTFLNAGLVEQARAEAARVLEAAKPFMERGVPVIGLEPSCLVAFRDEYHMLSPGKDTDALAAASLLLTEFLERERMTGRFAPSLRPIESSALVYGHCHQKAINGMGAALNALSVIPGLNASEIGSSCCGMAGGFGYRPENLEMSLAMGELSLFPAIRNASRDTLIIADGFSCRQQIRDGVGRTALHSAIVFKLALNAK
jgi:FAD/FMN-containing dehydrogenase/Fe-S oxidoreductase